MLQRSYEKAITRHEKIPPIESQRVTFDISYDDIFDKELVGWGGFGAVYRGRISVNDCERTVALKEPFDKVEASPQIREQFTKEADLWSKLADHPHITTVHAWGRTPFPWMALEYAEHGSLYDVIPITDPEHAVWIANCIVDAVHFAHRHGVVHFDLKPENVLLMNSSAGCWPIPSVSDWGLSELLLEHIGSVESGTWQYAAPEQIDPDQFGETAEYTDYYQCGALLYALLTGRPPAADSSASAAKQTVITQDFPRPRDINPALPRELERVILKAMAPFPADRYDDIIFLKQEVETLFFDLWNRTDVLMPGVDSMQRNRLHVSVPSAAPTTEWSVAIGAPPAGSPLVSGNQLMQATQQGELIVLNSLTGSDIATIKLTDGPLTAPVIHDAIVVGERRTGEVFWINQMEHQVEHSFQGPGELRTAPTLFDSGTILAYADGTTLLVDERETVWTTVLSGRIHHRPARRGECILFPTTEGITAVDGQSGDIQWRYPTETRVMSTPAIADDLAFLLTKNHVHCLNHTDGSVNWRQPIHTPPTGLAVTAESLVISGQERIDLRSQSSGEITWTYRQPKVAFCPPIVTDSRCIAVFTGRRGITLPSQLPDLLSLYLETGTQEWGIANEHEVHYPPSLTEQGLYVTDQSGTVIRYH